MAIPASPNFGNQILKGNMTREIRFRAWDEQANEWRYFQIGAPFTDFQQEIYDRLCIDGVQFYQYCGLKDKNGKDIYEGDCIDFAIKERRCNCDSETELFSSSKFCPSCGREVMRSDFIRRGFIEFKKAGFYISYKDDKDRSFTWGYFAAEQFIEWIEVIGDIHTRPDLLTIINF
jgi:uncharacterized phage protein (TIGR01671 family)